MPLLTYSYAPSHHSRGFASGLVGLACLTLLAARPGSAWAHGTHDQLVAAILVKLAANPADPALHFDLARTNLEHGDWEITLLNLDRVEQLAPGAFPTDLLRGRAWLAGGKPAQARPMLDRFVAAQPENGFGWLYRARSLTQLGCENASLADYREALQRTPRLEPDLVQEVAKALAKNGEYAEAATVLAAGIERLGPAPGLVLSAMDMEIATGRYDAALTRIAAMQKTGPRPEPWMAKRATVLTQAGRHAEAQAAWAALIAHLTALPNLERGSHAMSILAEQARRGQATAAALAKPPEAAPEVALTPAQRDATLRFPLRRTFADGNNHEEELESLDRAIEAQPTDAARWFLRAGLLGLDNQQRAAYADCDEVDRLAPGQYATDRIRGQLLTAADRLDEAKTLLDAYVVSFADDPLGRVARARLLLKMNQADAALADFRAALRRTPTPHASLYQEVATALSAQGCPAEALEVLSAGLVKNAGLPGMTLQALDLEIALGHFSAALARVDVLQKTAPRPEPWMARRAALLAEAGRADEARTAWTALRDRLAALPNLERGTPSHRALADQASQALTPR